MTDVVKKRFLVEIETVAMGPARYLDTERGVIDAIYASREGYSEGQVTATELPPDADVVLPGDVRWIDKDTYAVRDGETIGCVEYHGDADDRETDCGWVAVPLYSENIGMDEDGRGLSKEGAQSALVAAVDKQAAIEQALKVKP